VSQSPQFSADYGRSVDPRTRRAVVLIALALFVVVVIVNAVR
jgi:hypothetical protein